MIENKGGIIIPPKNSKEIIRALDYLDNEDLRKEMSLWNNAKVNNVYTIDQVFKKMHDCYQKAINDRKE